MHYDWGVASLYWIPTLFQTLQGDLMGSVLSGKLDNWENGGSEKLKVAQGRTAKQWQRWGSIPSGSDLKACDFSMM